MSDALDRPVILGLDTATRQATVAVTRGEQVLAQAGLQVTTHSEGLLQLIHDTLRRAGLAGVSELDGVACGRGPGSFTGLRIGLATAKGLCLATEKPLLCVSSLLPLGRGAWRWLRGQDDRDEQTLVAAVLDARRKEVFCGLFRGGEPAGEERLLSPDGAAQWLGHLDEPLLLCGDGASLYGDTLPGELAPEDELHAIQARHLCLAALPRLQAGDTDDLDEAVPTYLRASDARLPAIPQIKAPS